MKTRLEQGFQRELSAGKKLFVPFLTAGDRGLEFTRQAVLSLAGLGADAIELGVPFSDPLADGPVIQRSSQRALRLGTTLDKIFALVREVRKQTEVPLLLMGYLNPFLQKGMTRSLVEARQAGVDGLIVPDFPPEEAGEWVKISRQQALNTVFLAAPTSTPERLCLLANASSGYVYYVSVTGITGARPSLPPDLPRGINRVRRVTPLPILVGFGVSTPELARSISRQAEGVIVGSALEATLEAPGTHAQALRRFCRLAGKMIQAVKKP